MSWYTPKSTKQKAVAVQAPAINTKKLIEILQIMDGLNGKKTSEMSREELMVTEMFFRDYAFADGKMVNENSEGQYYYQVPGKKEIVLIPKNKVYRRMKLHAWAFPFILAGLIKTKGMTIPKPKIEIINDANINWLHLSSGTFRSTGAPMYDALNSFPDNYLPIRKYKGRRAATHYTNKTINFDPNDVGMFKERDNFLLTEADSSLPTSIEVTTNLKRESSIDILLQTPWSMIPGELQIDIVRGLRYPEEFKQHFKTDFDLTSIKIPANDIENAQYFLDQLDAFRSDPVEE